MRRNERPKSSLMSKFITLALLAGLVAGGWWLFRPTINTWPITNHPRPANTIVAFGDSLTRGMGGKRGHDYPRLLSERIGRPIINAGVDGDTTASALKRLERDVIAHKPDWVLVCLGGNDLLGRTPTATMIQNLREIVTRIQAGGAVVVLIGVKGSSLLPNYDEAFHSLAEETGCILVPNILDNVWGRSKLMADQIHPNSVGYFQCAKNVAVVIDDFLY